MYNRRQQVSVVSIKSDDMVITRGVPQGSALDKLTTSVIETLFDFHIFSRLY